MYENYMKIILIILIIVFAAIGLIFYGRPRSSDAKPLKIEIIKEGMGQGAQVGNTVFVHYVGFLENGTKFDSSLDREKLFSFVIGSGQVIPGWEQGILEMKVGEKRKLTIAPELAYGSEGIGGVIPPNATLIFEVELFQIK